MRKSAHVAPRPAEKVTDVADEILGLGMSSRPHRCVSAVWMNVVVLKIDEDECCTRVINLGVRHGHLLFERRGCDRIPDPVE
jgi:hypothetical protein